MAEPGQLMYMLWVKSFFGLNQFEFLFSFVSAYGYESETNKNYTGLNFQTKTKFKLQHT